MRWKTAFAVLAQAEEGREEKAVKINFKLLNISKSYLLKFEMISRKNRFQTR